MRHKFSRFGLVVIAFSALLSSCIKENPNGNSSTNVIASSGGVYVINEGNFLYGNSSLSYFNPTKNSVSEDVFKPTNNRSLGDVAQSIYVFNGKAYIVVNNSGKIEIADEKTMVVSGTISGLTSPRYFLPVNAGKAYVSDYKANAISIVDLISNTKTGSITCAGFTEEMISSNGKVFVTNKYRNKIYVINPSTDKIIDSISVGYGSGSIKKDVAGKLWVLCEGDQTNLIDASLYRVDPATHAVLNYFNFNTAEFPSKLRINGSGDTLYFLKSGVYQMSINDANLPTTPLISQGTKSFYALGVDPVLNVIYVGDAIDYIQKSTIYRYTDKGTLISSFKAGINAGDFSFVQ